MIVIKDEYTPAELRTIIDYGHYRIMSGSQSLEVAEARMADCKAFAPSLDIGTFERLRSGNRRVNESLRTKIKALELVLAHDEAVNGWQGEDRKVRIAA